MDVQKVEVTIRLSETEINALAHALRRSLDMSVAEHYKNHPVKVFEDQTRIERGLLRELYGLLGQPNRGMEAIHEMKGLIRAAQEG